jgi:plastocyanin
VTTRRFAVLALALLAASAGLAACGPPPAARTPQTLVIVVDKLLYGPPPIVAHVGDTIEWDNHDIFEHSATADEGAFDLDLPAGGKATFTLKQSGVIRYHCKFHPGMLGQITVTP